MRVRVVFTKVDRQIGDEYCSMCSKAIEKGDYSYYIEFEEPVGNVIGEVKNICRRCYEKFLGL